MQIDASLKLDTAQTRIKRDRIAAVIGAYDDYSVTFQSDCYVTKQSGTVLLRPAPMHVQWALLTTGIYARLKKADYTLTSARWTERDLNITGFDSVLDLVGANEAIITTAVYAINQAWYVKWMAYGNGHDDFTQMECGMNSTATGATGISFRMSPTGSIECWKDGTLRETHPFCGTNRDADISGKYVWAIFIPGIRRNGCLVITSQGAEFEVYYDDLDETDPTTIVTPATKFWSYIATGGASVQAAAVYFPSNGFQCSKSLFLAEIPGVAESSTSKIPASLNGGSVTAAFVERSDGTTTYAKNDTPCRMRLDLSGISGNTPFVYGAMVEYAALQGDTPGDDPTELIPNTVDLQLNVPEGVTGATLDVTLRDPFALEMTAAQIAVIENRPIQFLVDGILCWDGVGQEPEETDHFEDEGRRLTTTYLDKWALLEQHIYRDPKIWDGENFPAFVADVLNDAGCTDTDIQIDPFNIPNIPPGNGKFNCMAQRGENGAQVLQRGFEAYAGLWLYGFRPVGGVLTFRAGDDSVGGKFDPANVVMTIYKTQANAMAALGLTAKEVRGSIYRELKQRATPVEANFVKITGITLATGDPIEVQKSDVLSMDPTIPVLTRPDNWLGTFRPLGIFNRFVTSIAVATAACNDKFDKVTKKYFAAEFGTPFMARPDIVSGDPLWKGDVVVIEDRGTYRITSLQVAFHKVNDDGMDISIDQLMSSAPAHYTAIRLSA